MCSQSSKPMSQKELVYKLCIERAIKSSKPKPELKNRSRIDDIILAASILKEGKEWKI